MDYPSCVTRISVKAIARITHCPPMIEKPIAGELAVEETREIDRAGNNALYRVRRALVR